MANNKQFWKIPLTFGPWFSNQASLLRSLIGIAAGEVCWEVHHLARMVKGTALRTHARMDGMPTNLWSGHTQSCCSCLALARMPTSPSQRCGRDKTPAMGAERNKPEAWKTLLKHQKLSGYWVWLSIEFLPLPLPTLLHFIMTFYYVLIQQDLLSPSFTMDINGPWFVVLNPCHPCPNMREAPGIFWLPRLKASTMTASSGQKRVERLQGVNLGLIN